jgi:zinc transport system permease protein
MISFFRDMAVNPLLVTGFVGGLLASVACGVIGPYVITRRIAFLAGAVAHAAVAGIGAVLYLRHKLAPSLDGLDPLHGALVAALLSALLVGLVKHFAKERLDTLIGALWSIGMAVGILLVKITPGYHVDLMSYLFGNIAIVSAADVRLIAILDVIVLVTVGLWHKRFMAACLDEEFTRLKGVSVLITNLVLLSLVALSVVALIRIVGLILVIALLTLPAATAGHLTRRMGPMILLSTALCLLVTTLPRAAVYGSRISPESAIVLASGGLYIVAILLHRLIRLCRRRATSTGKGTAA